MVIDMVRAFVDAPIDQSVTDKMKHALEAMLIDAIERHSVSEFYVSYHDIVHSMEKILRKLKARYPHITMVYLLDPEAWDKNDELVRYTDMEKPRDWQLENCQVRLVMYICSECFRTTNNTPCDKRDLYEGKVPSKHIIMRLEDYIKE